MTLIHTATGGSVQVGDVVTILETGKTAIVMGFSAPLKSQMAQVHVLRLGRKQDWEAYPLASSIGAEWR